LAARFAIKIAAEIDNLIKMYASLIRVLPARRAIGA
jgi:hypothetical protein